MDDGASFYRRYRREGSNIFQWLKEAADGEVFFVPGFLQKKMVEFSSASRRHG
jgi:hypothetical protein